MSDEEKRASFNEKPAQFTSEAGVINLSATPEEEKRLVRKLDRRILPILCLLYLFACGFNFSQADSINVILIGEPDLDRTNLGNARLQGLVQENLHGDPTGVLFDWVNSAFFFSYVSNDILIPCPSFYLLPPRLSAKCLRV
jgi:hypothetical protein